MNKGLSLATGEVVGFLNADDFYANNLVLRLVASVFADPYVDACYADLIYVDKTDENKTVRYWKSCDYQNGMFSKGWVPAHPTFFVRKTIYEKYGTFDLNYKLAADFELMMRFMEKHKINTVYVPKVFVEMRLGGESNRSISNIIKQNLEIFHAAKKNEVVMSPFSLVLHKVKSRIYQYVSKPTNEV